MDRDEQMARALTTLAELQQERQDVVATVETVVAALEAPGRDGQKVDAVHAEMRRLLVRMGRG